MANLASAWLVPLIYIDFEIRQDYIAKVLCIERDKPMTVCKGRCFLTDQLSTAADQQEKEEQANPTEIVFFFQRNGFHLLTDTSNKVADIRYSAFAEQRQSNPHLMGIFHPPRS